MTILDRLTYALVSLIVAMFVILVLGTQGVRGAEVTPAPGPVATIAAAGGPAQAG